MNTPAHILLGIAAFGRVDQRKTGLAAFCGAVAPDLSLYLMAGVSLFVLGIPPQRVFNELYFSDAWQTVFAVDNSFFVWGAFLALAVWSRKSWGVAFAAAGILHLLCDFPLHHDDGRPHFWPVSGWVFESPLSYWDRAHGAMWVAPLEALLCACAFAAILWRRSDLWLVAAAGLAMAAEIWIVRQWLFVFST